LALGGGEQRFNADWAMNLVRLIDEVVGTAGQLAEKNQNRLVVEAQENVGALNADPLRLKQILLKCKIWYLTSRTVSDDDAQCGNADDRSVRVFAVKPRAFGAPPCGIGA
jgi:hypothetical protein